MPRAGSIVLLAFVCALLVVVAAGAESDNVHGFNYEGFSIGNLLQGLGYRSASSGSNPGNSTVTTRTNSTAASASGGSPSGASGPLPSFPTVSAAVPDWLVAGAALACAGGAFVLVLRRRATVTVVDLGRTLEEMEHERKRLEGGWSRRLRNAALLRYFLLMRRACVKVGLRDEPAETPQEYVRRVSTFFGVDRSEAEGFASAVNRSRYGEELTEAEAREASRLMGIFSDVIRRKAGEGA